MLKERITPRVQRPAHELHKVGDKVAVTAGGSCYFRETGIITEVRTQYGETTLIVNLTSCKRSGCIFPPQCVRKI